MHLISPKNSNNPPKAKLKVYKTVPLHRNQPKNIFNNNNN